MNLEILSFDRRFSMIAYNPRRPCSSGDRASAPSRKPQVWNPGQGHQRETIPRPGHCARPLLIVCASSRLDAPRRHPPGDRRAPWRCPGGFSPGSSPASRKILRAMRKPDTMTRRWRISLPDHARNASPKSSTRLGSTCAPPARFADDRRADALTTAPRRWMNASRRAASLPTITMPNEYVAQKLEARPHEHHGHRANRQHDERWRSPVVHAERRGRERNGGQEAASP